MIGLILGAECVNTIEWLEMLQMLASKEAIFNSRITGSDKYIINNYKLLVSLRIKSDVSPSLVRYKSDHPGEFHRVGFGKPSDTDRASCGFAACVFEVAASGSEE